MLKRLSNYLAFQYLVFLLWFRTLINIGVPMNTYREDNSSCRRLSFGLDCSHSRVQNVGFTTVVAFNPIDSRDRLITVACQNPPGGTVAPGLRRCAMAICHAGDGQTYPDQFLKHGPGGGQNRAAGRLVKEHGLFTLEWISADYDIRVHDTVTGEEFVLPSTAEFSDCVREVYRRRLTKTAPYQKRFGRYLT